MITNLDFQVTPLQTFGVELNAQALARQIRYDLHESNEHMQQACAGLATALHRRDWQVLGHKSAEEYISVQLGMSPSWGWALARVDEIKQQFPEVAERIRNLDISKATTIAAAFPQNRETRIFDADQKSVLGLVTIAEQSSVRQLHQTIDDQNERGARPTGHYPEIICPHCNKKIEVTRACDVVIEG